MFLAVPREFLSRSLSSGAVRLFTALAMLFMPIARAAKALTRQRRIRRAHEELMALDDRTLHDLGIDRSEIGRVVRWGRDGFGMEFAARDAHPIPRRWK
jgi:uncharacterized protein YjiS (DUF1127 family)